MLYIKNKINHHMEKLHVVRLWRGPDTPSPPDLARLSNTYIGNNDSIMWMKSLWDSEFITVCLNNTEFFFSLQKTIFPTQFLSPLSLTGSTFCDIKIKQGFNMIVNSYKIQLVTPTFVALCVCHIWFPLHLFSRLRRSLKLFPLTSHY